MADTDQQTPSEHSAADPPASPPAADPTPAAASDAAAPATDTAAAAAEPEAAAATEATAEAAAAPTEPAAPAPPPRVVIVTGANSGIGFEVTRMLCEQGHDVVMACRNEEKTNRAIEKLRKQNPKAQATYMHLDLACMESIRKFVDDFHATEKKLSVLVNNAGLALNFKDTKRQYTKDNFELTIGTNHLGPFLLTNLLLDDLKKTSADGGDARIVVVSSMMHDIEMSKKRGPVQPIDLDNLFLFNDGTYTGLQAYKNSKLANLLFTYELAHQLSDSGIKVNAVCPGFVPTTELMRSASGAQKFFTRYVLHGMLRFTKQTRTVGQAATQICALAVGDKFKDTNGKFIRDGTEAKSSDQSMDEEKQKKLWQLSGGYTRLDGFEPIEVPPPPAEPVKEEPKAETKTEGVNGDTNKAAPETGDGTVTADSNKAADAKEDEVKDKDASENKVEEKKDEEKDKENEKKEEVQENKE